MTLNKISLYIFNSKIERKMDFYLSPPKNICFMDGMRVYED